MNSDANAEVQGQITGAVPQPAAALPTARSVLVDWANGEEGWLRSIVAEVIKTRAELSDQRVKYFYNQFLRERKLEDAATDSVGLLSSDPGSAGQGHPLVLHSIESIENVNLLATGQSVEFGPQVTIFFGENASGKSGYVRILKSVAKARSVEQVLPNITDPATAALQPRARIKFAEGPNVAEVEWHNQGSVSPLTRIDIFDSKSAQIHLDDDLTYVFTPGELALFPLIQQSLEKVRRTLDSDIHTLKPQNNPFVTNFQSGTSVHGKISLLSPSSDIEELRTLSKLSEADQTELSTLEAEINALRSNTPEAQLRVAEGERTLLDALKSSLTLIRDFDTASYDRAVQQLVAAQAKYAASTKTAFAGVDIPGVLEKEWQAFVEAGEAYIRKIEGYEAYPQPGVPCVYCRQGLDAAAVELLRKYRDYNNGALRDQVNNSRHVVDRFKELVRSASVDGLAGQINSLYIENKASDSASPFAVVVTFLGRARLLLADVLADKEHEWSSQREDAHRSIEIVDARSQAVSALVIGLKQQSTEKQQLMTIREAKATEFRARKRLSEMFPQIEDHVRRAKWANAGEAQSRSFQGIFRALTSASKEASQTLLNQGFENHFRTECTRLRAPVVKLGFPGRQGQVTRKKTVASEYQLSEILSEGEQKVIALADFIAELRLKKPTAPVVFDDPITSLDYRRIKEVSGRIIELSLQRQVIIFSHNIWFVTELLAECAERSRDFLYFDIQSDGNGTGLISRATHPRADSFKKLKSRINDMIQKASSSSGDTQREHILSGYEYLRNACEVIVEVDLLRQVTQRYGANVKMTMLPQIKGDRLEAATNVILPVYEKCCRYMRGHSQPLETLNIQPPLAELRADWVGVQEARDKYIATN